MIENFAQPSRRARPSGFTLVELLVTISVIGILAAALVPALFSASEMARVARTEQTVRKIDEQVIARWEKYENCRLPINPAQWVTNSNRADIGRRRLSALRELVRMEMPDRYLDLMFEPQSLRSKHGGSSGSGGSDRPVETDLKRVYIRHMQKLYGLGRNITVMVEEEGLGLNASAECLYMMLTLDLADADLFNVGFSASESADTDRDGMYEFVDAWGLPIHYLRWAPGFDSDLQPVYSFPRSSADMNGVAGSSYPATSLSLTDPNTVVTRYPTLNHDSFDPLQLDRWTPGTSAGPERGYMLSPLVTSGGPNQDVGLYFMLDATDANDSNPYATHNAEDGTPHLRGDRMSGGASFDNIHNQQSGAR